MAEEYEDSDSPPPGRPGDTDDYFVPFYQMNDENSTRPHPNNKLDVKTREKPSTVEDKEDEEDETVFLGDYDDDNKVTGDEEKTNAFNAETHTSPEKSSSPVLHDNNNNNNDTGSSNRSLHNNNDANANVDVANTNGNIEPTTTTTQNTGNNGTNTAATTTNNTNNKAASRKVPSSKSRQVHRTANGKTMRPSVQAYNNTQPVQRDFSRATKWDIVYLTSSPLVFGNDPYKPLDQLDISGERDAFFSTLKASKQQLRVIHKTATTSNIIAAVTGGCRCIHYSGHGYPSYLAFEDAKRIGETHLVHYDLIRKVCEDEDQRIEFVFASACHSEHVGEAFIEAGIQHVVAVNTKFEVTDEAASMFTKHFYNTLLNGRTIEKSFKIAKHAVAAMATAARLDYDKFLLLPRDGDHDVHIFNNLEAGELVDDTATTPVNNLPPAVPMFVGRAIDMRHIIHQLMDSGVRLLVLTGNSGIGKSATALMVARYFCDRRMFRGGIFYIDVKKLNAECDTLSSMLLKVFEECDVMASGGGKSRRKKKSKSRRKKKSKSKSKRRHLKQQHSESTSNTNSQSSSDDDSEQDSCDDYDSGDDSGDAHEHEGTSRYVTSASRYNNSLQTTRRRKKRSIKKQRKEKEDVFNIIRNMGEMLLVFDGLDQFGEGQQQRHTNHHHHQRNGHGLVMSDSEIQDSIQAFLQNIFEKCSIDTKVLVTSSKKLHMFADFTNCISRYYMLRKLKPKDAAKLFSRLCNQFRHTDIVSNQELMRVLDYNPKQITKIVQIKHQYHCDTLESIVKAYETKSKYAASSTNANSVDANNNNNNDNSNKNNNNNSNDAEVNVTEGHSKNANNNNHNGVDNMNGMNMNAMNMSESGYPQQQQQHQQHGYTATYSHPYAYTVSHGPHGPHGPPPSHGHSHSHFQHQHQQRPMHPHSQFASPQHRYTFTAQQRQHSEQQLKKHKQMLMEKFIVRPSARVLWGQSSAVELVLYPEISAILRSEFHEMTGSTRQIKPEDFLEAFKHFGKMNTTDYKVGIQYFNAVYEWFVGITQLVKVLAEEWNEIKPCAIAGFVPRDMATNLLRTQIPGTFLIRFSTTALQSIAISYRDVNSVEHIKATLLAQNAKFAFNVKNNQQNYVEMSLVSFVQKFKKITHLLDVLDLQRKLKGDVYFGAHSKAEGDDNSSHHSSGQL